jgi:hypothetical protein
MNGNPRLYNKEGCGAVARKAPHHFDEVGTATAVKSLAVPDRILLHR